MKKILYLAVFGLVVACNDTADERTDGYSKKAGSAADSLFQDVMDGHDVAMAKMGKIEGYRKLAEKKLDSLGKKTSDAGAAARAALQDLSKELEEARNGMNRWMDEFSIDSAEDNPEKRVEYLQKEKQRVNEVKERIFTALSKADSLLNK